MYSSAVSKPTSATLVERFRNAERLLTKARNIPEPDRKKRIKRETEPQITGKVEISSIGKDERLLRYIFFNLSKITGVFERGHREQCLKFHFKP